MTRRLLALALAGLAALACLVEASPTPSVRPADAAAWEGQEVRVQGLVRGLRAVDGGARFDLLLDGHAVAVRLDGPAPPEGSPVVAKGRLGRLGGALTLFADHAEPTDLPGAPTVRLAALGADPATWAHRAANVTGLVEKGRLKSDGASIALGEGDWPRDGPVGATVLLAYDAACACHRLDRVAAWAH